MLTVNLHTSEKNVFMYQQQIKRDYMISSIKYFFLSLSAPNKPVQI